MKIEDSFRVEVPVEEAWKVLLDLERIAPCLPGAQLTEVEGDEYRGTVKIKAWIVLPLWFAYLPSMNPRLCGPTTSISPVSGLVVVPGLVRVAS